jgi:hypothetical protein
MFRLLKKCYSTALTFRISDLVPVTPGMEQKRDPCIRFVGLLFGNCPHRSCPCVFGAATIPVAVNLVMSFRSPRKANPTCLTELLALSPRPVALLPC